MAKTWAEILKEHVDSQRMSHEQQHRAFQAFQTFRARQNQGRVLWNVPSLTDGGGQTSVEDVQACLDELKKLRDLSDEDLAKFGLRRMPDGFLVATDFVLNKE